MGEACARSKRAGLGGGRDVGPYLPAKTPREGRYEGALRSIKLLMRRPFGVGMRCLTTTYAATLRRMSGAMSRGYLWPHQSLNPIVWQASLP